MTAQQSAWTESDSQKFLSFSEMITPSRAEQMVMLANLVPAASADAFAMAEIGCGGGEMAARLLADIGCRRPVSTTWIASGSGVDMLCSVGLSRGDQC